MGTQPSEVDTLRDEYCIKTEEIAEESDDSLQLPINKRPHQISLPLLDKHKPSNATIMKEIAQKESAVKGPWRFDATEKSKTHDIEQLKKLILPSDRFFRLKRLKSYGTPQIFSLKENGEEYMFGSEVSC